MTEAELVVNRHAALDRYEGRIGTDLVTVVDLVRRGDVVSIVHTGTEPAWRGRGLAGQATRAALEDLRTLGVRVDPACPFARDFMDAHPEFDDLRVPRPPG